ncbi:putative oxidoreductase [Advenella incenata]|jgi:putative oxidoreductase|uniref:Putative oxidoreductase n=1 Tax=Advenella incenata TaxID=267800 RepID=A0A4Q7VSV0_9BURK|nr:DoxX family protein [Advenella incenata]RZT99338.1 putative oxidoreductase [Advenella incenata]
MKTDHLVPYALALLRIVSGYTLVLHGTAKYFHVPHIAMFDNLQALSMPGIAGMIELVAGILLILGLFTRSAAFIASGMTAVAYFYAHAPQGNALFPLMNGGETAVLYCFIFLFIAAAGPGTFSIDSSRKA